MAMDQFIKISGIQGESNDHKHKGEIDVLAWSWGMSQAGSFGGQSGGGSGKVNVQDLSFTKYIDKSTPDLMLHCCNGKHIPDCTLVVRKAGGDNPLEYLTIKMSDVLVSSVSTGGSGGEDRLTENVTLNFAKVNLDYKEQTAQGGVGATPKMGWDVKANQKL
jgi:type VI secretion system secreted protein Hcp